MNLSIKIMNSNFYSVLSALLCSFFIIACSSSDGEGDEFSLVGSNTSIAEIAGNWNATKGLFQSASLGPATETDVVAEGGSVTLSIQTTGQFSITVKEAGRTPDTSTGRMAFDEDLLVIFFDDDPGEWEYFGIVHNEPNLSIQGGNGSADFDFDGDGTKEPAYVDFEFVRI
jgi:hypothetical protein